MPITVAGTQVTFNDSTVQTTAFRAGITSVTLTSASPNATITTGNNQLITIVNDSTTPIDPSVTLPAMNTLPQGAMYFEFANMTPFIVALKDSAGTVREFIQPGANYQLSITNNGSATGQWFTQFPVAALNGDQRHTSILSTSFKPTSGAPFSVLGVCRLNATAFAVIFYETNVGGGTYTLYARLYTYVPSTKTYTTGNTVTIMPSASYYNIPVVAWDSDNAGHAFVGLCSNLGSQYSYFKYVGLSVSGGTLYASAVSQINGQPPPPCTVTTLANIYVGYLGSNNAFAYGFWLCDGSATGFVYTRGATVTGTTTVTLTESPNNTGFSVGGVFQTAYGARTSLTTFVCGAASNNGTVGYAVSYTPGTNGITLTARSNTARLDIEQGATAALSSFSMGGYMTSTNKSFFGTNVFDVTGAGTSTVTTVPSTGFNFKYNLSPNYSSFRGAGYTPNATRSSIYVSSTSIIAIDGSGNRWQCDPSSTTLNLQSSSGYYGTNRTGFTYFYQILDSTTATNFAWSSSYSTTQVTGIATPIIVATPITA
jgi:hypothetical protein